MTTLTISPQGALPPEITDHADTSATCGNGHQAPATGMIREVNS